MKYILASASPRRKELMQNITEEFLILPSRVEEIVPADLPLVKAPAYLAKLKAEDIAPAHFDDVVIGADTGVFVDGRMLGKPRDRAHAKEMLETLSGRTHKVITGCCVCHNGESLCISEETEVTFYSLSEAEIEAYLDTSEPYDKAGAYGIQGKGVLLVEKIHGDYFNVVGLPVARLARTLKTLLMNTKNSMI